MKLEIDFESMSYSTLKKVQEEICRVLEKFENTWVKFQPVNVGCGSRSDEDVYCFIQYNLIMKKVIIVYKTKSGRTRTRTGLPIYKGYKPSLKRSYDEDCKQFAEKYHANLIRFFGDKNEKI